MFFNDFRSRFHALCKLVLLWLRDDNYMRNRHKCKKDSLDHCLNFWIHGYFIKPISLMSSKRAIALFGQLFFRNFFLRYGFLKNCNRVDTVFPE